MKNLKKLPVICSMGGLNSAGRTSGNIGYKRLIYESLSDTDKSEVLKDLMSLSKETKSEDFFKPPVGLEVESGAAIAAKRKGRPIPSAPVKKISSGFKAVSYTHLRAHETLLDVV